MSPDRPILPLQGKAAIVTGASRGIGAGIAIELGKRGANVNFPFLRYPDLKTSLISNIGYSCLHIRKEHPISPRCYREDHFTLSPAPGNLHTCRSPKPSESAGHC